MSRQVRRSQRQNVRPVSSGLGRFAGSIVLVDEEPLRAAAEERLRDYLKQLHSVQTSLRRFEERDVPDFEQWRAAEFGERLTVLRELREKVSKAGWIVDQVEEMRYFTRRSYKVCYEQVKFAMEHPEEARQQAEEERRREQERFGGEDGDPFAGARGERRREFTEEEREQELLETFAEMLGCEPDLGDPVVRAMFEDLKRMMGLGEVESARGVATVAEKERELKRSYRTLARKLHPDHREDLGAFEGSRLDGLWHEAQEAYRLGDIEALERIEAIIDIEVEGVNEKTSLSRIEQAAERHRQSLRAVERTLRQARKSPAWMFSKKPQVKKRLKAVIERELRDEVARLRYELLDCEGRIARWEADVKRASGPGRKAAKVSANEVGKTAKVEAQEEFAF